MEKEHLSLNADSSNVRLDVFLFSKFPGYSRSFFQRLIQNGLVTINGAAVDTPHHQVKEGDAIEVDIVIETKELVAEDIPLDIVHEDKDILVVNKSPGMVVHPACGHWTGTLLNALAGYAKGKFKPMLVHRLDKDTSGIIIVAKTEKAKNSMVKQFQGRTIKKMYLVAVKGCVEENKGRIEAPLGRDLDDRLKIVVGPLAKKMSITEFSVLKRSKEYSLLEAYPVTGRTHQIRSHMVYIGHPVLGDSVYDGPSATGGYTFHRQMLHASRIRFTHPSTCKPVEFSAPLPPDMEELWKKAK